MVLSPRTSPEIRADVRRSAKAGLWIGLALFAFGALRLMSGGSAPVMSFLWLLPVYAVGGALAGGAVGLVKPLTTHLPGAMLVGALLTFPVILAISFFVAPSASLSFRLKASVVIAAILGPFYALALWRSPTKKG
jgi:hypothetical protein